MVRTNRRLPASNTPMADAIRSLLDGPSTGESGRGLISLIPQGTRLLSAEVRGNTAYINFSDEYRYNRYGADGHYNQVRQVVFTATEFASVIDVQILINGSQVHYIGESTWIGSPLSRADF